MGDKGFLITYPKCGLSQWQFVMVAFLKSQEVCKSAQTLATILSTIYIHGEKQAKKGFPDERPKIPRMARTLPGSNDGN